jgi:4-hydroxy-4-methyl-2-oxoglutarate aldolase
MTKRISPELLETLRGIDSATVTNAIEVFKIRDRTMGYMDMSIRCQFPEFGPMVGYAVTAIGDTTTPGPPPSRDGFFLWLDAIAAAEAPTVCVIQDASPYPSHSCHFGEVMSNVARSYGVRGLITNGGIRDVDEVKALGFHYFAPGRVVAHGNNTFRAANIPVTVGGLTVNPGDLIHADVNGVVIIPTEIANEIPDAVEQLREKEGRVIKYVNSGTRPDLATLKDIFIH